MFLNFVEVDVYMRWLRSFIAILLRGFLMGTADTIPGVSGGTMALITGIYERLVHSISKISFKFLKPLFKGDLRSFTRLAREEIDFELFIPLLTGIGVAVLTVSRIISFMITYYAAYTYAFFLGLILASAYLVFNKIDGFSLKNLVSSIIGFIFAFLFVGLNPIQANHTLPVIFISGMVAICAMILPGISGAFMLLLLNQYEYMLGALIRFSILDIIAFIIGAAIGIISFSRFLDYLLRNHESMTMAFLVGLMIGTLRLPYGKMSIIQSTPSLIPAVIIAILGFFIVFLIEKRFHYIEY
ncbi:MAG: putative rane protein [Methanobacteriaceae archaeon]|nr:putative rane protein [Methanobacteriaceae archaeon]